MSHPKARLAVSAVLFLGWLGYLLYLVVDSRTVILSRPQFLMAQLVVVADIGDGPGPVVVDEVLWSADPGANRLVEQPIRVVGIAELTPAQGYHGPGKYLLPLVKSPGGSYLVEPLPRVAPTPEILIYPWTRGLRGQVDAIVKSRP